MTTTNNHPQQETPSATPPAAAKANWLRQLCALLRPKKEQPDNPKPLRTADVIEAERQEVERQRSLRFPEENKILKRPEAGKDHVGLCFSGGGIRSATLNLGIMQGMRKYGLLTHVDYLSTVSGGGYIGSWFCATRLRLRELMERKAEKEEDRAKLQKLEKEAAALLKDDGFLDESVSKEHGSRLLRHLRQHSRYLAPKDGITSGDTWTMASVWLRNTLLIQLMVLALIFAIISAIQALPVTFQWLVFEGGEPEAFTRAELGQHVPWLIIGIVQVLAVTIATVVAIRELKIVNNGASKEQRDARAMPAAFWISGCLTVAAFAGGTQIFRVFSIGSLFPLVGSVWKDAIVMTYALILAILSVCVMYATTKESAWRALSAPKKAAYLAGGTLALWTTIMAIIWALASLFQWVAASTRQGLLLWNAEALSWSSMIALPVLLAGYGTVMILAVGLLGRYSNEKSLEWMARAGAWIIMANVLLTLAISISMAGPVWVDWLLDSRTIPDWIKTSIVGGWLAGSVGAVLAGNSEKTCGKNGGALDKALGWLPLIMIAGLLLALSWAVRWCYLKSFPAFMSLANWLANWLAEHGLTGVSPPSLTGKQGFLLECFTHYDLFGWHWLLVTGVASAIGLLLLWRVDLNQFSMNPFYRNRLVRCYLGASRLDERSAHGATGFDFEDDLPLEKMHTEAFPSYPGPLQIINTAANAGASAGNDVQDRSAEAFAFTPLHVGFDFSRYSMPKAERDPDTVCMHRSWRTTCTYGGGWTLGQALSVSGAAASPNSGYHTSPLVAFMLTLFNARLGWWAPHPGKEKAGNDRPHGLRGFLGCLVNELTGSATLDKDFIYLSDGGHFENLGLYELVRRGCRVIIVGDGECDPDYNFHALGTAIRRCKVDFGVEIEIDPREIIPDPVSKLSRSHVAFGTITYPQDHVMQTSDTEKKGMLIYLKSSVTGAESLAVKQYRGDNPDFPHESTADQFFSEAQFESYRELGRQTAMQVFRPITSLDHSLKTDECFHDWLKRLEKYWKPPPRISSTSFINHTLALTDIWRQVSGDPLLAGFDLELMPEWSELVQAAKLAVPASPKAQGATAPATPPDQSPARKIAYVSQEIIQLMENVYLDLDLHHDAEHEDHQGWMMLFRYWAGRPSIRNAWERSRHLYGKGFERFWIEALLKQTDQKEALKHRNDEAGRTSYQPPDKINFDA